MRNTAHLRPILFSAFLALFSALSNAASAAVVLDWSDWDASFVDGQRNWQSYTNSDGVQIRYRNGRIRNNGGTDRADFLFDTPAVLSAGVPGPFQPFNGTGGAADHYLDIYQQAGLGNGTRHRFQFDQGLDGASVEIWDIDSSTSGGRNFTDEVRVFALDSNGQEITPTRAIITNGSVVTQVSADTWRGVENAAADSVSTDGNLVVFFDVGDITEIQIEYLNYDYGNTASPTSDAQAIGIYNISETGNIVPPVVPEPSSALLALSGAALILRRRR